MIQAADIKAAGDCREYIRDVYHIEPSEQRGEWWRFRCPPWNLDSNSSSFAASKEVWKYHAHNETGSIIDLVMLTDRCEFGAACRKLAEYYRLEDQDTRPRPAKGQKPRYYDLLEKGFVESRRYVYQNADGSPAFEVVRLEWPHDLTKLPDGTKRKEFCQCTRREDGSVRWSIKDVKRVPYHLPELLARPGETIWLNEGEKDVETLERWGLLSTTFAQGAGNLKDEYAYGPWFKGRNVVILRDNDEPGQYHGQLVRWYLQDYAATLKILTPSTLEAGDVTDWIEQESGTRENLEAMAAVAPVLDKLQKKPERPRSENGKDASRKNGAKGRDHGHKGGGDGAKGGRPRVNYPELMEGFLEENTVDGQPRYRYYRGAWREFREGGWHQLMETDLDGYIASYLRKKHALLSETKTVRNVKLNLGSYGVGLVPARVPTPCWLDEHFTPAKGWLALQNGALHLPTACREFDGGECLADMQDPKVWQPLGPNLFSLHYMTYPFDPTAQCPLWLDYIAAQHSPEDQKVLQMLCGLALVPETKYNVMFFLQGPSGTGKSVFLHVLQELVGRQNICSVPLEKFDDERHNYQLTESLLNIVCDMEDASSKGFRALEGVMKKASDGEIIDIRYLYQNGTKANVTARSVFSCNELPKIHDRSNAIWRRLRVIPFENIIAATDKDDVDLRFKIAQNELPGVFLWALQGLGMLQELRHFPEHSRGLQKKGQHRMECDTEGTYLQEHYTATEWRDGQERALDRNVFRTSCHDMNEHYSKWAEENNYGRLNAGNLARAIKRVFGIERSVYRDRVSGQPTKGYQGLALKDESQMLRDDDFFLNQQPREAI